MSKIVWDKIGERFYETGVKNGVLYVQNDAGTYGKGVAWNGLATVTESPSGAEPTALYADDIKYLTLMSAEEFGGTIEAYTYPPEFAPCNGEADVADGVTIGQQKRSGFGFCYRTVVGNDVAGNDYGYKLHIVWGALASPSEKSYSSINDSPEAQTMSWEFTTTPVAVEGYKPTSIIVIDSKKCDATKLAALEARLYGTEGTEGVEGTEPSLPSPAEVITMMKTSA